MVTLCRILFPFIIPNIICLCTVTRCPDRSGTIQDGYRRCHPSSDMVLGTVCRYGCYQGHTLKGAPSTIECTDTGEWSNRDEPYCESKEILFVCLRIAIIINFFNKCNNIITMDEQLYNYCWQGREPDGEPKHITCREDNIVSLSAQPLSTGNVLKIRDFFVSPIP